MHRNLRILAALLLSLGALLARIATSDAQENPVTAIDIALEPDATMIQHAEAANARLLKVFPKGFHLDATHTRTSQCCSVTFGRKISIKSMPLWVRSC